MVCVGVSHHHKKQLQSYAYKRSLGSSTLSSVQHEQCVMPQWYLPLWIFMQLRQQ